MTELAFGPMSCKDFQARVKNLDQYGYEIWVRGANVNNVGMHKLVGCLLSYAEVILACGIKNKEVKSHIDDSLFTPHPIKYSTRTVYYYRKFRDPVYGIYVVKNSECVDNVYAPRLPQNLYTVEYNSEDAIRTRTKLEFDHNKHATGYKVFISAIDPMNDIYDRKSAVLLENAYHTYGECMDNIHACLEQINDPDYPGCECCEEECADENVCEEECADEMPPLCDDNGETANITGDTSDDSDLSDIEPCEHVNTVCNMTDYSDIDLDRYTELINNPMWAFMSARLLVAGININHIREGMHDWDNLGITPCIALYLIAVILARNVASQYNP